MSIIQGNTKVSAGGYSIDQSIRFDRATSSALYRTQGTPDGTSWTLSFWIKRGQLRNGSGEEWFINGGAAYPDYIRFESDDQIRFRIFSRSIDNTTTAYFRDPGAWYHFVANWNGSTGAYNLWQNNVSLISGTGSSGETYYNKSGQLFNIGRDGGGSNYFDGYFAEIVKLDNTVADPTSFGEYNDDGVWVPVDVSGLTFGSEGFYIKGQDSSNLGDDSSGNTNDFTTSGLTSADQVTDSPTLNFPVISPIDRQSGSAATITDGNLKFTNNNTATSVDARATFALPKGEGKWYFEMEADILGQSGINREYIGIVTTEYRIDSGGGGDAFWQDANGFSFSTAGSKGNNGSLTSYGSAWSAGDIIGCAVDLDNNKIWWSINNTWQASGDPAAGTNAAFTTLSSDVTYAPAFAVDYGTGTSQIIANFGQTGGLTYTPPTGFSQIDSSTLPTPAIADGSLHFNPYLYTGDGSSSTRSFTGMGFQPDFVWKKIRSSADHHWLHDAVRGATKGLNANRTDSEYTSNRLTSFDSDGFSFATSDPDTNGSGSTYVAWSWKGGNSSGSSNTDGSVTSTVSANTTAKFSVITYTGTGSAATVGHGLGAEPQFIAIKGRTNVDSWGVYPGTSMGYGGQYRLKLNENSAIAASSVYWNNTDATSSVFTVNTDAQVNGSGVNYVAYCFAEVPGFSKMGFYTGNGSADGPMVLCNFRPAFILVKEVTAADDWLIYDSSRDPENVAGRVLRPDSNAAEFDGRGGSRDVDFLSNGFKFRSSNATMNGSGAGYIFMAFAEHPFGGASVAPVPAR